MSASGRNRFRHIGTQAHYDCQACVKLGVFLACNLYRQNPIASIYIAACQIILHSRKVATATFAALHLEGGKKHTRVPPPKKEPFLFFMFFSIAKASYTLWDAKFLPECSARGWDKMPNAQDLYIIRTQKLKRSSE